MPREGQEENSVEGWMRRIRLRAGDDARVIIVATHGDERRPELDLYSLQLEFGAMLVEAVSVDSRTGNGMPELRELLARTAAGLPQMGQPVSPRWRVLRESVLSDTRTHISISEYDDLLQRCDVSAEETSVTLEFLNRTGSVVHFAEDSALSDLIILKP